MTNIDNIPANQTTAVARDRFLDALGAALETRASTSPSFDEIAQAAGITVPRTRLFPRRQDPITSYIARQTKAHEILIRAARQRLGRGPRAEAAAHLVAARVPADGDHPMLAAMLAAAQSPDRLAPVISHYEQRLEILASDPDSDLLLAATLVADALWFLDAFGVPALAPERRQALLARLLHEIRQDLSQEPEPGLNQQIERTRPI